MSKPLVHLVVAALVPEMGIGANGKLPWRLKQEMKYFKDVTSRAPEGTVNAVVMGRRTWELIPKRFRPLPNRANMVISRSGNVDGAPVFSSFDTLMESLHSSRYTVANQQIHRIFVIGGAQVYNNLVTDPRVLSLLLTKIEAVGQRPEMDTFFKWDSLQWKQELPEALRAFVDVPFTPGPIHEGDYIYEYTLWLRYLT